MNIEIIEVPHSNLNFKGKTSCTTFNSSDMILKELQDYSRSVTGIIILDLEVGTITAKFSYSTLADDGNIEIVGGFTNEVYSTYTPITLKNLLKLQISMFAYKKALCHNGNPL